MNGKAHSRGLQDIWSKETNNVEGTVAPITKPVEKAVSKDVAPVTKPVEKAVSKVVAPVTTPVEKAVSEVGVPTTKVSSTFTPSGKAVSSTVTPAITTADKGWNAMSTTAGKAAIAGAAGAGAGTVAALGVAEGSTGGAAISTHDNISQGVDTATKDAGKAVAVASAGISVADKVGGQTIGKTPIGEDVQIVDALQTASQPCQDGQYKTKRGQCAAAIAGCAGGAFVSGETIGCTIGASAATAAVNVCGGGAWTTVWTVMPNSPNQQAEKVKCLSGTAEGAANGVSGGLGTDAKQNCASGKWKQVQLESASNYKASVNGIWYSQCEDGTATELANQKIGNGDGTAVRVHPEP